MCRSIKTLRNAEIPATEEEIRAAPLQFVSKFNAYRKPSRVNEQAFESAILEISQSSQKLLEIISVKEA